MTATRVPAAIDALVAALEAVLGPEVVFDGPELTGNRPDVAVCVGYDGNPDGEMRAVRNWAQTWAGLGAQRKDETFDVVGVVLALTGDTAVKARRDAVFTTFGAVADALRDQANIGLGLPQPTTAAFTAGDLFQEQRGTGLQLRIPWVINVKTRI